MQKVRKKINYKKVSSLSIYRQKTLKRNSRIIYLGEDVFPYSDDGILLVADGLGGRGGFRHNSSVVKDILANAADRKEEFCKRAFADVFENHSKIPETDKTKSYFQKCFWELFEMRKYYNNFEEAVRTSGYFASRFVAATVLYELKFGDRPASELFSHSDDPMKAAEDYSEYLVANIKEKLGKIAENLSLVNEANITGAYLLPTTLNFALYKETSDNKVDVYCFWAGDSRAYMWDKDGLHRLTKDHEKNEAMTNLVSLSKDFFLETAYFQFEKPCVLFNMSDGVYKSAAFKTPLHMEASLLKIFSECVSLEKAGEKLKKYFEEIGNHDDSGSMAVKTLGYKNYQAFKRAVDIRRLFIKDNFIKALPDILTRDYEREDMSIKQEFEVQLNLEAERWIEMPEVRKYIAEIIREKDYKPFTEAIQNAANKYLTEQYKTKELTNRLKKWGKIASENDLPEALRQEITERMTDRYWRANSSAAIKDIWYSHREILPEPAVVSLNRKALEIRERNIAVIQCIEKRNELMKEYYERYDYSRKEGEK